MLIETQISRFQRVRSTNATDNGFPSRVPTGTLLIGNGTAAAQASAAATRNIVNHGPDGMGKNVVTLVFYGVGSDNATFSARLIGWRRVYENGVESTSIWIPVKLCEVAVTLSTAVGVAGKLIDETNRFADTIALTGTTANDDVSIDIVSPADNTIAHMVVDFKGAEVIEVTFTTGGSATSCNALWATY